MSSTQDKEPYSSSCWEIDEFNTEHIGLTSLSDVLRDTEQIAEYSVGTYKRSH